MDIGKALIVPDEIEEIAMAARGGVGPFAGGALSGVRPQEADIERAAGRIVDVANEPVAALPAAVREIVAANRLGVLRQMAREVGDRARGEHGWSSSRGGAVDDRDERMAFDQPVEDRRRGGADGHEEAQLP